ncbi:MAG: hypothetical protein AAGF89_04285 [Bacteroidota bacterium]
MTTEQVNELLERYFAGETSLAEEKQLRTYFLTEELSTEHEQYLPLFAYWDLAAQAAPSTKVVRRRLSLRWLSAAAAVMLLLVANSWFKVQPDLSGDFPMFAEAVEAKEPKTVDWSKYEVTDKEEAIRILHAVLKTTSAELNRVPAVAIKNMNQVRSALK